nr:MAG TPA: hypothetical protein [Caudoviricetes sp.]
MPIVFEPLLSVAHFIDFNTEECCCIVRDELFR